MSKSIIAQIKNHVHADMVSRKRNGNILIRKGYFYRGKQDEYSFADSIIKQLTAIGITAKVVEAGDHWAAFNGGAPLTRQSHFYVELAV